MTVAGAARAFHRSRRWPRASLPTSPTLDFILASAALVASTTGAIGSAAAGVEDDDDEESIFSTNNRLIKRSAPSSSGGMTPPSTGLCLCDGVGVGVGGWSRPPPSSETEMCRSAAADESAGPASPCIEKNVVVVAPPPPPLGSVQLLRLFPSDDDDNGDDLPWSAEESADSPLRNSVLLIPDVISPAECSFLRGEADRLIEGGSYGRDRNIDDEDGNEEEEVDDYDDDDQLRRVSLCDMSPSARELSRRIIFERVLPTLESFRGPSSSSSSSLCRDLGLGGWDSPDAILEWASDEPSVNVYTAPGGRFDPHRDGYALTVIVLLSEDGAFEGGGTEFFRESGGSVAVATGQSVTENIAARAERLRRLSSSVLVRPPRGTAVCFDGDVTHAGSPVRRGVRHLFVASFGVAHDVDV